MKAAARVLLATALLASGSEGFGGGVRVENLQFASRGETLRGSLALPDGAIRAGIVFVHGAGKQTRNLDMARRFADQGIAALVYDKRGVGESGGEYEADRNVSEQNLALLAEDARAALRRLATHRELAGRPVGYAGFSQGGWIAPLAALQGETADFLVLWSGPVCKVSEENVYSKYTADADEGVAPPYQLAEKARRPTDVWPEILGRDTDASADLAKLSLPGLWIYSDNDTSIPVDLSLANLQDLRRAGHRYDYVLFSGLGHDNVEATLHVGIEWIKTRVSKKH